jgi:hypothetical protein
MALWEMCHLHNHFGGAGRARTDDDGIMSSEAMTGSSMVERG